jgi:hypothetical protein
MLTVPAALAGRTILGSQEGGEVIKDDEPLIAYAVRRHVQAQIQNLINDRMIQGEFLEDLDMFGVSDEYNDLLFHVLESQLTYLHHVISTAPVITLED